MSNEQMADLPGALRLAMPPQEGEWSRSTDALAWARAWMETIEKHPEIHKDEGTMIGWFANAIMAGYDEANRRNATLAQPDPAEVGGEVEPAAVLRRVNGLLDVLYFKPAFALPNGTKLYPESAVTALRQRVAELEKWRELALRYDAERMKFRDELTEARRELAEVRGKAVEWLGGQELQTDSYATGRHDLHAYRERHKGVVHIAITDGACSWAIEIPLPKEYKNDRA